MGKFQVGDKVKVKDKPGWQHAGTPFRFANAEGEIIEIKKDPGQDYEVYLLRLKRAAGHGLVSFMEDEIEKIE